VLELDWCANPVDDALHIITRLPFRIF